MSHYDWVKPDRSPFLSKVATHLSPSENVCVRTNVRPLPSFLIRRVVLLGTEMDFLWTVSPIFWLWPLHLRPAPKGCGTFFPELRALRPFGLFQHRPRHAFLYVWVIQYILSTSDGTKHAKCGAWRLAEGNSTGACLQSTYDYDS